MAGDPIKDIYVKTLNEIGFATKTPSENDPSPGEGKLVVFKKPLTDEKVQELDAILQKAGVEHKVTNGSVIIGKWENEEEAKQVATGMKEAATTVRAEAKLHENDKPAPAQKKPADPKVTAENQKQNQEQIEGFLNKPDKVKENEKNKQEMASSYASALNEAGFKTTLPKEQSAKEGVDVTVSNVNQEQATKLQNLLNKSGVENKVEYDAVKKTAHVNLGGLDASPEEAKKGAQKIHDADKVGKTPSGAMLTPDKLKEAVANASSKYGKPSEASPESHDKTVALNTPPIKGHGGRETAIG